MWANTLLVRNTYADWKAKQVFPGVEILPRRQCDMKYKFLYVIYNLCLEVRLFFQLDLVSLETSNMKSPIFAQYIQAFLFVHLNQLWEAGKYGLLLSADKTSILCMPGILDK